MRRAVVLCFALLTLTGCLHPPPKVAPDVRGFTKEQKIRKLLELTGAEALGKQTMDGMMSQFEMMPSLPPGFAQKFRELAMKKDLMSLYVPVYAHHLDEKEIDAAIVFYESPEGRTFSGAQPAILRESMELGQKWGIDLAKETMKELQEERIQREDSQ